MRGEKSKADIEFFNGARAGRLAWLEPTSMAKSPATPLFLREGWIVMLSRTVFIWLLDENKGESIRTFFSVHALLQKGFQVRGGIWSCE